jgi:Tol biopolymer transport system component
VDISEVAIAPDGDEIAFVSDRSGAYELWTLALVGGAAPGEPVQRTHEGDSVSGVSYSPDGRSLVFATATVTSVPTSTCCGATRARRRR